MRSITKRLLIANRADNNKNIVAMDIVSKRYIDKMAAKGWQHAEEMDTEGDSFLKYERYVHLYK